MAYEGKTADRQASHKLVVKITAVLHATSSEYMSEPNSCVLNADEPRAWLFALRNHGFEMFSSKL